VAGNSVYDVYGSRRFVLDATAVLGPNGNAIWTCDAHGTADNSDYDDSSTGRTGAVSDSLRADELCRG